MPRLSRSFTLAAVLVLLPVAAFAQAPAPPTPIQDNSFLIEEAYNQTPGVVQTIQTYQRGSSRVTRFSPTAAAPSG